MLKKILLICISLICIISSKEGLATPLTPLEQLCWLTDLERFCWIGCMSHQETDPLELPETKGCLSFCANVSLPSKDVGVAFVYGCLHYENQNSNATGKSLTELRFKCQNTWINYVNNLCQSDNDQVGTKLLGHPRYLEFCNTYNSSWCEDSKIWGN